MPNFFWGFEMKTMKTALVLFLFLLLALPRTAFAQGEFLDVSEVSGKTSESGFLSGDKVSSITDSIGDAMGDVAGDMAGSAVENMLMGGVVGDLAGDYVTDLVSDAVGDWASDMAGNLFGDLAADLLSAPEISSIIGSLEGMASNLQGAMVGPNIPYYRVLWMFSGESVVNEVKSLFSGDFSNLEEGLNNLKEMF